MSTRVRCRVRARATGRTVVRNDPLLAEQMRIVSRTGSVTSDPPGADVYYKPYGRDEAWRHLGRTPLKDITVPRWAGKSLPTIYHWCRAADQRLSAQVVPASNFAGKGLAAAGTSGSMTRSGTRDMAGNVKERCATAAGSKRYSAGMAPLFLAVEPRIKLGVLIVGGFYLQEALPEADPVNSRLPEVRHHGRDFPTETHGIPARRSNKGPIRNAASGRLHASGIPGTEGAPMARRRAVPASPAFEAIARGARFRDLVAITVNASPDVIFQALHEVTLRDMKLAWLLGEIRYLPSRLAGRMPPTDSTRPLLSMLLAGGTLVLRDEAPREMITGSAAQLHRVHQAPRRFATREAFDAFDDSDHEKLFMSVRVAPTGRPGEHWLVLEHATRALSPVAGRKFARYWRVIKPIGALVTWRLLRAVRRRAERRAAHRSRLRVPWRSVRATPQERTRVLPGDERIPAAIDTLTHAVTIRRPPRDVWPWLVQMGAGSRGGWYSYDWLDNRGHRSATRIVPELQHPAIGSIFPAMPGVTEGFTLLAIEAERVLTLGWPAPDGTPEVTWTFVLDEVAPRVTRMVVRARGGPGYRFHGLPLLLTRFAIRIVHFIMQRKQLLGIARRAETTRPCPSAFITPEGKAAFLQSRTEGRGERSVA